ncbi:hypothetical protein BH11BAC3_BH11BAC3_19620 [soil metagenome]
MLNPPLFSIITVTYNSSQWVQQAIESILGAGYDNMEYLITDDQSNDGTWEIIEQYADSRLKKFKQQTNIGEYANRNFGLRQCTGEYVLFVDGDDYLLPGTLQKLETYIKMYPGAGSIWGVYDHYYTWKNLPLLLMPEETVKWIFMANYLFAHIGFSETVFKREELLKLGGLPENFIGGDTFIKKAIALEVPVLLVPSGLIFWRISDGQASAKLKKDYQGFRQNVRIDKEMLKRMKEKKMPVPVDIIERNIAIRNIKLLFKHTFLKRRLADGISLFKELHFSLSDLKFLFVKGDYSFKKNTLKKSLPHGD